MKKRKIMMALAAAFICVGASAKPVNDFRSNDYIACDAHSTGAILMAKKAVQEKRPVEDIVNQRFEHPQMVDVKLSLMAQDMIRDQYLELGSEQKMQGFLTGICYETLTTR